MANTVRNVSLAINIVLGVLVLTAGGWIWQSGQGKTGSGTSDPKVIPTYESYINYSLMAKRLVGRPFPKWAGRDIKDRPVSTDFSGKKGGIVLVFKPATCQPCLIMQLKSLQHTLEALEDSSEISICGFSDAPASEVKRFTRAFALGYPVVSDSSGSLMHSELVEHTPVVFLVDEANTIIDCHVPCPGKPEFSLLWYNFLRQDLPEKLGARVRIEESSFGLKGVPFVDVIRNEFDATNLNVQKVMN